MMFSCQLNVALAFLSPQMSPMLWEILIMLVILSCLSILLKMYFMHMKSFDPLFMEVCSTGSMLMW